MTATVHTLFEMTASKPKRHVYTEDFNGMWKVWRQYMARNNQLIGKQPAFKEYRKIVPSETTAKELTECGMAYGKWCKSIDRLCMDPERFIRNGVWRDFLPDSDSKPETPLPVAQSDLSGEIAEQWQRVIERLHEQDGPICRAWLLQLRLVALDGSKPVLQAPTSFHAQMVESRYWQLLRHAWGREVAVR